MSTITGSAVSVSALIQTSLAPMFLLTAVGATLTVIDNRLNRIVDRARALEPRLLEQPEMAVEIQAEIDHFIDRSRMITKAVGLCATTALCVAAVVIVIFIDLQTTSDLSLVVELLFVLAVVLYASALTLYLRDVMQVGVGLSFCAAAWGGGRRAELPSGECISRLPIGSGADAIAGRRLAERGFSSMNRSTRGWGRPCVTPAHARRDGSGLLHAGRSESRRDSLLDEIISTVSLLTSCRFHRPLRVPTAPPCNENKCDAPAEPSGAEERRREWRQ